MKNRKKIRFIFAMALICAIAIPSFAVDSQEITMSPLEDVAEVLEDTEDETVAITSKETRDGNSPSSEDLELKFIKAGKKEFLHSAINDEISVTYQYNSDQLRTEKNVNGIITTYSYNELQQLVHENRDGLVFEYFYTDDDIYGSILTSFCVNGETYNYIKSENQDVVGIEDTSGNEIARYIYDSSYNLLSVQSKDEDGQWVDNDDPNFIGNLNLMRFNSYYYDEETGWYYCGRFYDIVKNEFVDGMVVPETNALPRSFEDIVDYQVDLCLSRSDFGAPLNYGSEWYSDLLTSEVITRLIYAESENYNPDQRAVAYCIVNRYHSPSYPDTVREIATQSGQFVTIVGDSQSTYYARRPATSSDKWELMVRYACAVVFSTDCNESEIRQIFTKPLGISDQTQFRAGLSFLEYAENGDNCIEFLGDPVEKVCLPGVDVGYTNVDDLDYDYRNEFDGESNIYFEYS